MALDDLVERLGAVLSRRKFLARAGSAFLGATYAILGLPQPAHALTCVRCCCLCHPPSDQCCGGQVPYCVWSWTCCGSQGKKWRCSEYYCGAGDCNSDCLGVTCSKLTFLGSCSTFNACNVC
jgi:hypothetical protein